MHSSKDSVVKIDVVNTLADAMFVPAAWSVINVPTEKIEAEGLMKNLFNTSTYRHVSLVLCRHRRKDRLRATANIHCENWNYLDTISIWYEKPSSCSNNGFLPLAEPGWLLYKGNTPDTKKTEWFSDDNTNATNFWNLSPQKDEGSHSHFQKFSWEMNLLLMSLSLPLENRTFIYGLDLDKNEQKSLFSFCRKYSLRVQLYVTTDEEAKEIIKNYELFIGGMK